MATVLAEGAVYIALMADTSKIPPLDPLTERALASELFNLTWQYLDMPTRDGSQDAAMLHAVHSSCWHWRAVGGPEQHAIGEWLCSRVYAVLGDGALALLHAQQSLAICEQFQLQNFVPASAHEALARAYCLLDSHERAISHRNLAYHLAIDLPDDDDRAVIEHDLSTLPLPAQ